MTKSLIGYNVTSFCLNGVAEQRCIYTQIIVTQYDLFLLDGLPGLSHGLPDNN